MCGSWQLAAGSYKSTSRLIGMIIVTAAVASFLLSNQKLEQATHKRPCVYNNGRRTQTRASLASDAVAWHNNHTWSAFR